MKDKIEEFILRRFSVDCNWLTGNCYFFALILHDVFGGDIYYDVVNGHFLLKCGQGFYDWTGKTADVIMPVKWDKFNDYDSFQKERIIRDCIE